MSERRIVTESGAVYIVSEDGKRITRKNENDPKRGDESEQALVVGLPQENVEGQRLMLFMKSLAHLGPDDLGTDPDKATNVTTRNTTIVVEDSWEKDNVDA